MRAFFCEVFPIILYVNKQFLPVKLQHAKNNILIKNILSFEAYLAWHYERRLLLRRFGRTFHCQAWTKIILQCCGEKHKLLTSSDKQQFLFFIKIVWLKMLEVHDVLKKQQKVYTVSLKIGILLL